MIVSKDGRSKHLEWNSLNGSLRDDFCLLHAHRDTNSKSSPGGNPLGLTLCGVSALVSRTAQRSRPSQSQVAEFGLNLFPCASQAREILLGHAASGRGGSIRA